MKEIWMDIPHYEGLYQVSNLGRVKSLARERINHTGGRWIQPEKIMILSLTPDGYYRVSLQTPFGTRKTERVHRLVALAFIENPEDKPEVNHINCIRNDNRVENLEWVTREENNRYASECGNKGWKQIRCLETGEVFNTSTDAAKTNGGDSGNIRKSAKSQGKYSVKGFHYTYL